MRTFALALIAGLAVPTFAHADSDNDWQYRLTPYIWAPSLQMDAGLGESPSVSSDTDLLDVLDFAFLISGEARKGDWALVGEFNYLALSDDVTGPFGVGSADAELSGVMAGAAVAYRFLKGETWGLDAMAGFRLWSLEAEIDFANLPTAKDSSTFVDPIIGIRGRINITESIELNAETNIGGFGVGSELQWDIAARAAYKINETFAVAIGYRHLALELDRKNVDLDVAMSGPFIAVDIKW